jgi:hypothetical protein
VSERKNCKLRFSGPELDIKILIWLVRISSAPSFATGGEGTLLVAAEFCALTSFLSKLTLPSPSNLVIMSNTNGGRGNYRGTRGGRGNGQGGGQTPAGGNDHADGGNDHADGYIDRTSIFDCEAIDRVEVEELQLRNLKRWLRFYGEALDNAAVEQRPWADLTALAPYHQLHWH